MKKSIKKSLNLIIDTLLKMRIKLIALVLILNNCSLKAQEQPVNNAVLNYTQVLLEIPEVISAEYYEFKVVDESGDLSSPFISQIDSSQVTIVNDLEFGTNYKWQVNAYNDQQELVKESRIFHFQIDSSSIINPNTHRFRILKDFPDEYEEGVIFLDYSLVAINRQGKPVWFLPEMEGFNIRKGRGNIRDLKITSRGTLTFNAMKFCREITLSGKVLWETASLENLAEPNRRLYHHEFTRLESGNYMALGIAQRFRELVLGDQKVNKIPVSTIIEYNENHDTTWMWASDSYISDHDLLTVGQKAFKGSTCGHMNSFYVNEEKGEVYAGYRDLNAIVVIDKKTRKVIRSYGDKIPSDTSKQAIGFFKRQHAPVLMTNGNIILFNNNEEEDSASSILIFNEALSALDTAKKVWEFDCDFDGIMPGYSDRMGNVQPVDSSHYLVNMGHVSRLFEVTRDKKITWDCLPEIWDNKTSTWKPERNYRLAFSKSLYPYYVSFSLKNGTAKNSYSLSIVNEGSEDDTYSIRIIPGTNEKKAIEVEDISIKGESTLNFPLDMLGPKQYRKGFTIELTSCKNDLLTRRRSYGSADFKK